MGHQQLLLLVLGVVIVGLAVGIGIDAFDRNHKKANLDGLVDDGLRIAGRAQSWKAEAPMFGGGANQSWNDLTWTDLSYSTLTEEGHYKTPNGYFELSVTEEGFLQLVGRNNEQKNKVTITVEGLGADAIVTIAQSM